MRPYTLSVLICAALLALCSLPLMLVFPPVGLACCIAGLLLAILAVPGLTEGRGLDTALDTAEAGEGL